MTDDLKIVIRDRDEARQWLARSSTAEQSGWQHPTLPPVVRGRRVKRKGWLPVWLDMAEFAPRRAKP